MRSIKVKEAKRIICSFQNSSLFQFLPDHEQLLFKNKLNLKNLHPFPTRQSGVNHHSTFCFYSIS